MPTPYKVLSRPSEITPPPTPEGSGSIPASGSAFDALSLARQTLEECRFQFIKYKCHHLDKNTAASLDKAQVNEEFQQKCETAIAALDRVMQNGAG